MLSKFFIERPIFANVIAYLTMLLGIVMLDRLPVAQYPEITPPTVQVTATYPGASSRTVAETVALPIEQQVNGVENMLYMQSTSASDGTYKLIVTFKVGTDMDFAQVLVQNRVAIAMPQLPAAIQAQGVVTKKVSTAILQIVSLTSNDPKPENKFNDGLELSNYAWINLRDEIARLPGVGDVNVSGAGQYSMRVWVNADKLYSYGLTPTDVISAIQAQNNQVAAGQIGMPPTPPTQDFQLTVNVAGRLDAADDFENIIVKAEPGSNGRIIRIKDVGKVELGQQTYSMFSRFDGQPSSALLIFQLPGANALSVADSVREKMSALSKSFPPGIKYTIGLDTTDFTKASINEVYKTLWEAAFLVLAVILVFLQDWRAVLVPATTVPVTIIGAFIAMAALGFSVNMVTLFALILAIGIVVDDAIVIVEGAAHGIEQGMTPKDATIKAMGELIGPVMGITAVLMAVFLPATMMQGITGELYRQFALVIASTAVISAINAVTLKPAQCAQYLKPHKGELNRFYKGFNRGYQWFEDHYTRFLDMLVHKSTKMLVVYAILILITVWGFLKLPTGFMPTEDQGYGIVAVQLPDSSSLERTKTATAKMDEIVKSTPGIAHWVTIGGSSVLDNSAALSNAAVSYIIFDDFDSRIKKGQTMEAIFASLKPKLAQFRDGYAFTLAPPPIQGLGAASGFQMQLELKGSGFDFVKLQNYTNAMMAAATQDPAIGSVATTYRAGAPQLYADVDRLKASTMGVNVGDVFSTMQGYLGSVFVNQFTKFGRTYQVYVQAESNHRMKPEDIRSLYTKNLKGSLTPLGALVDVDYASGPAIVSLFNLYPTAGITGSSAPGYSSGEAMTAMEEIADKTLPRDMGFSWVGMSYQEKLVGNEAIIVFLLSALLVFMVLAAQYESWTNPAAVILVVPLALMGTVIALLARGFDNNVYTQIGLVLLVALASKNAILIVEVARELRATGEDILKCAVEASRRRLRPILMTSFAFILGVLPLAVAEGAGAASRRALGTAVVGGMLASTFIAILFVPICYVTMQRLSEWNAARKSGNGTK